MRQMEQMDNILGPHGSSQNKNYAGSFFFPPPPQKIAILSDSEYIFCIHNLDQPSRIWAKGTTVSEYFLNLC